MDNETQTAQPLVSTESQLPSTTQVSAPTKGQELPLDLVAGQPVVEGAAPKETQPAEPAKAPPGYRSEAEFRALQSAQDRRIAQIQREAEQTRQAHAALRQQMEQQQEQAYLQAVQAQGGDVNVAQQVLARQRAIRQREQELEAQHQRVSQMVPALEEGAKMQVIMHIADQYKKYGVTPQDLADVDHPMKAENKALKLALAKVEAGSKPAPKFDSGMTTGKGFNEQSIRKAYADGTIDTARYVEYLKQIGKQP